MIRGLGFVCATGVTLSSISLAFGQEVMVQNATVIPAASATDHVGARDRRRDRERPFPRGHYSIGEPINGGLASSNAIGQPIGSVQRSVSPAIVVVLPGASESTVTRMQSQAASNPTRARNLSTQAASAPVQANTSAGAAPEPGNRGGGVAATRFEPDPAQDSATTAVGARIANTTGSLGRSNGFPMPSQGVLAASPPAVRLGRSVSSASPRLPEAALSAAAGGGVGIGRPQGRVILDIGVPVATVVAADPSSRRPGSGRAFAETSIANPVGRSAVGLSNQVGIERSLSTGPTSVSNPNSIGAAPGTGLSGGASSARVIGSITGGSAGFPRSPSFAGRGG